MAQVFMSYAREDAARARTLAEAIESAGLSVWWDRSIPPGRTFDEVIEEALRKARRVIVLWSKASVESRWVRNEAAEADERGILVPVLIERGARIPLAHKRLQAADLTDWTGDRQDPVFVQFLGALKQRVSEMEQVPASGLPSEPEAVAPPPPQPPPPKPARPREADVTAPRPAPKPGMGGPPPGSPERTVTPPAPRSASRAGRGGLWAAGAGLAVVVGAILLYATSVKPPVVGTTDSTSADWAAAAAPASARAAADSVARADSVRRDSLARADSVSRRDSLARADSMSRRDSLARADSVTRADSLARAAAALAAARAAEQRRRQPTATISADPAEIARGASATLSWNTTNATSVLLSDVGPVAARGTRQVSPAGTATYQLTAEGPGGRVQASATIRVTAPPNPIAADGNTATMVVAADASGREAAVYRMVAGGHWVERAPSGSDRPTRQLREEGRSPQAVILRDDERNETLQLDFSVRRVAAVAGGTGRLLYTIVRAEGTGWPGSASRLTNGRVTTRVTTIDDYGRPASRYAQTGPGAWSEQTTWNATVPLRETMRDDWSVYLRDDARNVAIQLDMHTRRVMLTEAGRSPRRLYTIVSAQ